MRYAGESSAGARMRTSASTTSEGFCYAWASLSECGEVITISGEMASVNGSICSAMGAKPSPTRCGRSGASSWRTDLKGTSDMHKYEVIIHWSDEDGVFVAEAPELPGCLAHGNTQQAALEQLGEAVDLWLETAREFGDPIPEPKGERLTA